MKKRIVGYRMRIDDLLKNGKQGAECDWQAVLEEHLTQIAFFQHERLIHLIVTVTFAILTMISVSLMFITGEIVLTALILLFLVLLIPYVGHYYTLENEVQRMYGQYDEMLKLIEKNKI